MVPGKIKWAAAGLVVGILLAAIVLRPWRSPAPPVKTLDAPAVVHEIQRLSDLISVKYTVQKVVGLEEKKVPLGSEKLLLFVQAEVLAVGTIQPRSRTAGPPESEG